ncbi:hypothetical protein GCM10010331_44260 [Streptomyces xanthochromogenes]|uniref:hypothetical protein n=1 Tax=Streptomyces xanthochromogenes TaxID=67384 RepID=UPI001678A91B|nr:hypothetical protein [Streptomyces xanthochromogenes]GHB51867.1 hypothetical protein GCM10010331_44260 [Streptomyces xanthochromogenes]
MDRNPKKELTDLLGQEAAHEPSQLRRIAELMELLHSDEIAKPWWQRAAEAGNRDASDYLDVLESERTRSTAEGGPAEGRRDVQQGSIDVVDKPQTKVRRIEWEQDETYPKGERWIGRVNGEQVASVVHLSETWGGSCSYMLSLRDVGRFAANVDAAKRAAQSAFTKFVRSLLV